MNASKNIVMLALAVFIALLCGCPRKESAQPKQVSLAGLVRVTIESDRTITVSRDNEGKKFKNIDDAVLYIRNQYPDCRAVSIKSEVKMVPSVSDHIINAFKAPVRIIPAEPIVVQSFIVPVSFIVPTNDWSPGQVDLMRPSSQPAEISKDAWKQLTVPVTSNELGR